MPSEKLEKLKHERYVAERKLTAARHREKQLESEMKRLHRSERTIVSARVPECWKPF